MTVTVKHRFTSAKVDTLDNSRIQPSNWNDTHVIQCAGGVVLGRTAGAGQADVTELPLGATGQALLATATPAAARAAIVADDSQTTIAASAAKITPIDTDVVVILDSAAANVIKRTTWANIKATLKTYFDTLYQPLNTVLNALAAIGAAVSGDIIYGTGAGTWGRLPKGANNQVLQLVGGLPAWVTLTPPVGAAKAWVSYNLATQTVLSSFNVASVVRNGTGDFTITFTTPFADTNYCVTTGAEAEAGFPNEVRAVSVRNGGKATGTLRCRAGLTGSNQIDLPSCFVAVFAS